MSGINELIAAIRKEGSRGYVEPLFYATITKSHPDIELTFNDMVIVKKQIRYSSWVKFLCEGYVTDAGNGPETHNHNIRSNKLKKGDTVLIKYDEDRVLIIDRVVL